MAEESGAVHADAARDDIVASLKRELAEATERAGLAQQRASIFEERERERISGFQTESQFFFKDFLKGEVDDHHAGTSLASDIAPLATWSDEFVTKKDITSQGALAAASYVASKGIKRLRDQASKLPSMQESLSSSMKENEELKASVEKLQKTQDSALELAAERQRGLAVLQEQLSKAGMIADKFDFSKLTSREVVPEPHAAAPPALEAVTANASKVSLRANPLENDLLEGMLSKSSGGLRVGASGTQHAFLGAANGEGNLLASLHAAGF